MSNKTKIFIGIFLTVLVIVLAYLFYKKSSAPAVVTTVSSTSGLAGFDLGNILGSVLGSNKTAADLEKPVIIKDDTQA